MSETLSRNPKAHDSIGWEHAEQSELEAHKQGEAERTEVETALTHKLEAAVLMAVDEALTANGDDWKWPAFASWAEDPEALTEKEKLLYALALLICKQAISPEEINKVLSA